MGSGHPIRRGNEGEAVDVAFLDVLDEPVQKLVHPAVIDRQRVLVGRTRAGAEARARARRRGALRRLPCGRSASRTRPRRTNRRSARPRRRRRSRPADIGVRLRRRRAHARSSRDMRTRVGCHELEADALAGKVPQRQRRLESGDAAAGDHHAKRGCDAHRPNTMPDGPFPDIRILPLGSLAELRSDAGTQTMRLLPRCASLRHSSVSERAVGLDGAAPCAPCRRRRTTVGATRAWADDGGS